MLANTYSPEWFAFFLHGISSEQTSREVEFLKKQLKPHSRVLDLACGTGRHGIQLSSEGFPVVGIDRDFAALDRARTVGPKSSWVCADMRRLPFAPETFDTIVCLWQSFGYFEAPENANILRHCSELARPGGVLVLDLYHREFFQRHQGERTFTRLGRSVRERTRMRGDRLEVSLLYEHTGGKDHFDWQLFTPEELRRLALSCGWKMCLMCSGFDAQREPSPAMSRVPYVLERYPDSTS